MSLDFRTIFLEGSGILLALSFFPLLVSWERAIATRYLRLWSLAFPTLFLGSVMVALRGVVPELLSVLVSNIAIVSAYALLHAGLREYAGKKLQWKSTIIVLVGTLLADTWFTAFQPSVQARILLLSGIGTLYFGLAAFDVFASVRRRGGTVSLIAAVFLLLLVLVNFSRFTLTLVLGSPDDLLSAGAWDSLLQLLTSAAIVGLSLTFFALHSSRLALDLAQAAKDKDILFREMTHRTKNDLALVDSFISLQQSGSAGSAEAKRLDVLRDRIRCIAAAHDLLSRSSDTGKVSLNHYLEAVVKGLEPGSLVRIEAVFEEIEVGFPLAVPVGLLMNELATNSLRHAFPGERPGLVRLSLAREGDGLLLRVSDDGIGTSWPPPRQGQGTMIIESLVVKIGGSLSYADGGGSTWTIRFPL
ncbi:MAG: sensor histidine kinase [Spirochaetota bacterium]